MRARKVAPREHEWAADIPAYRVLFWTEPRRGDEWEVDGVDVHELLDWAEQRKAGRMVTIWAIVDVESSVGQIRLLGDDPSAA